MAQIPSMTELTNQINRFVDRETRLALLTKAGVAARSKGSDIPPVAILGVMAARLANGGRAMTLLKLTNGKLVSLGRKQWQKWHVPSKEAHEST